MLSASSVITNSTVIDELGLPLSVCLLDPRLEMLKATAAPDCTFRATHVEKCNLETFPWRANGHELRIGIGLDGWVSTGHPSNDTMQRATTSIPSEVKCDWASHSVPP